MNTLTIFVSFSLIVAMLCDALPPTMSKAAGPSVAVTRSPETCKPDTKAAARECYANCTDTKPNHICASAVGCSALWFCNECELHKYNCINKANSKERKVVKPNNCSTPKPKNIPCML